MPVTETAGYLQAAQKAAVWRRKIHSNPETAFEETQTAAFVAERLGEMGISFDSQVARTGIVAWLGPDSASKRIGLRADLDALPMQEENTFEHRSVNDGKMHACGHDGHTAMLLGAAEVLSSIKPFPFEDTRVYFIFQPAEENEGGGKVMVDEGLFERYPMDAVFGMHNWPGLPAGAIGIRPGAIMAAYDRFDITIRGRGCHAAMPQAGTDTILAQAELIQSLQKIVSRLDPLRSVVLSITKVHGGSAYNILPSVVDVGGTLRTFDQESRDSAIRQIQNICEGTGLSTGTKITFELKEGYPATVNSEAETELCREAARSVTDQVFSVEPSTGSEDFGYMLQAKPGCYVWLGNGKTDGGCLLHSPHYDFNDEIIETGIRYWVKLVETFSKR